MSDKDKYNLFWEHLKVWSYTIKMPIESFLALENGQYTYSAFSFQIKGTREAWYYRSELTEGKKWYA